MPCVFTEKLCEEGTELAESSYAQPLDFAVSFEVGSGEEPVSDEPESVLLNSGKTAFLSDDVIVEISSNVGPVTLLSVSFRTENLRLANVMFTLSEPESEDIPSISSAILSSQVSGLK